jgi:hypothetical protein
MSSLFPTLLAPLPEGGQARTNNPAIEVEALRARMASHGHGDDLAIVWQLESDGEIGWARPTADLQSSELEVLAESGNYPTVAETEAGYVIAWTTASGLVVQVRDLDGTLLCEATDVSHDGAVFSAEDAVALADTEHGVLAFGTHTNGATRLYRLDDDCNVEDAGSLGITPGANRPSLVVGGERVAALWSGVSGEDDVPSGHVRVFDQLLCE